MTSRRRLDRLEASLNPTAAVCLWLDELQAFRSLPAYSAWLFAQPDSVQPFRRIHDQVRADAEGRTRGQPRASIERAAEIAVRAAGLRVGLVLELNFWTAVELEIAALQQTLFDFIAYFFMEQRDRIGSGDPSTSTDREMVNSGWARLPAGLARHATTLLTVEEACIDLERQYLGGHPALVPNLAAERRRLIDDLPMALEAVRVFGSVEADEQGTGVDAAASGLDLATLRAAARAQAPSVAASRVAEARIMALGVLGDDRQAAILAKRLYLRTFGGRAARP